MSKKIIIAILITFGVIMLVCLKCKWYDLIWGEFALFAAGKIADDMFSAWADCFDNKPWQTTLRGLMRGKLLKKTDKIRISFAYLYRIQVGNDYLLVKNTRGTQKFQPVGGAYKYNSLEEKYLTRKFSINKDDKIKQDNISKEDYRLYVKAKDLRKFMKRFDTTRHRENLRNLGREFKEELIETKILNFDEISYRYIGRHLTNIEYSRVFNCYELLLADVVELLPTDEQLNDLKRLKEMKSEQYIFTKENDIRSCGVKAGTEQLLETIADHTIKILPNTETDFVINKESNKIFHITL